MLVLTLVKRREREAYTLYIYARTRGVALAAQRGSKAGGCAYGETKPGALPAGKQRQGLCLLREGGNKKKRETRTLRFAVE